MRCKMCNEPNEYGSNFCGKCGTKLDAMRTFETFETLEKVNVKEVVAFRLKVVTIICLCLGILFMIMAFSKKTIYEDDYYEGYYRRSNTYVNGDAYNYIINGTYFTGYSVIGMGFFIISAITGSKICTVMISDNNGSGEPYGK